MNIGILHVQTFGFVSNFAGCDSSAILAFFFYLDGKGQLACTC